MARSLETDTEIYARFTEVLRHFLQRQSLPVCDSPHWHLWMTAGGERYKHVTLSFFFFFKKLPGRWKDRALARAPPLPTNRGDGGFKDPRNAANGQKQPPRLSLHCPSGEEAPDNL